MNKLLQHQVSKYLGKNPNLPEEFEALLEVISESYDHHERVRKLLEGSIEINSAEMKERNSNLMREAEQENRQVFAQLQESLQALNESEYEFMDGETDFRKLSQLAETLKNETHQRKAAEREKAQRAAHLEASQKIAHIGSWEITIINTDDLDANPLYCSDEVFHIFGMKPEPKEVKVSLLYDCVPPEEAVAIQEAVREAIHASGSYDVEHRIILKDGTTKMVRERAEIIINGDDPIRIIGTIQDITKRKAAEEEIQRINYELKTLFENMQECFFTVDTTVYRLIQISPSCKEVYGHSVEEFMDNPDLWIEVTLEEDRAQIWAKQPNLERGESIVNIYRIRDKKGNIKWLESKLKPTLDENGKLVRLDGVTGDITKRKEAEIALKNSEYRFRSMIENASDAILIVNANFENTYASDSFYRIMGYGKDKLPLGDYFDLFHPEDIPGMKKHMKKVLKNPGKAYKAEYRKRKKDGSYFWCEGYATNLLHVPAVNGIVVNFRDITERKRSEKAIEASNEELRKSNNELDRFVYSVSHDLRAPLSSMLGIISLMEYEDMNDELTSDVELLKESINKLDGFIADILDYSRNSRMELHSRKIDFKDKLEEVRNNLKYMPSAGKPVVVKTNVQEDAEFYSDSTRCTVILNNLISNSIRYSNPRAEEPYVEVDVQVNEAEAIITIRDNGIGIAKEKQDRIFDMFYRVSQKAAGSGLGLYIVKETVEKLGGSLHLESQLDKGTCFTLTLPNLVSRSL